jgi:phosphoribosylamine---glycine ligase
LALGKGVYVCPDEQSAIQALQEIFQRKRFGDAGDLVVIEERLVGDEISLLAFCDGTTLKPMISSRDHKRRFDDDLGPNTGGMGAYAPSELYEKCKTEIQEKILVPLESALAAGELPGGPYRGVLYIGILVVEGARGPEPFVLEFNARFGDPETQTLMPLLQSDLLPILWACTEGRLNDMEIKWSHDASCCVVAATANYPEASSQGEAITVGLLPESCTLFHAGTALRESELITNGGRVLCMTAVAPSMGAAKEIAYKALSSVSFPGMDFRRDIAGRTVSKCPSV